MPFKTSGPGSITAGEEVQGNATDPAAGNLSQDADRYQGDTGDVEFQVAAPETEHMAELKGHEQKSDQLQAMTGNR